MGISVYENEFYNTSDDDDGECSDCTSNTSQTKMQQKLNIKFSKCPQTTATTTTKSTTTNTTTTIPTAGMLNSKDLVGNFKEFRIENNKCNLRIIGNGNRIRITNNFGHLQIIGNNTRLKINVNNGHIKYTGNEGRICLGSESSEQMVDYIGCNGLLKVINSLEFNKNPRHRNASCAKNNSKNNNNNLATKSKADKQTNLKGNSTQTTAATTSRPSTPSATNSPQMPKTKSASSESIINDYKNAQWQEFNDLMQNATAGWQHFAKVSLPNLKDNLNVPTANCKCKQKPTKAQKNQIFTNPLGNQSENRRSNISHGKSNHNVSNHTNIVNYFGNIIIKNSVNVSIA